MTSIELITQPANKGTQMNTTSTINGVEYAPSIVLPALAPSSSSIAAGSLPVT